MENQTGSTLVDLIVAGMILAFVLSTAIVLFVLIYQRKLAKERNEVQALKIEHQKALFNATIRAVEDERKQFAANLHDEIGVQLAIVKMTLSSISDGENHSKIEKTIEIMDSAVSSIHQISHNLLPPVLNKLGLSQAIAAYLKKLVGTVRVELDLQENLGRFDQEIELQAYRIIQEAISNAIKHSGADLITVQLKKTDHLFSITISNNGKGFARTDQIGLGLLNMQSRAELIGFDLKVNNSETGVSIHLTPEKK